MEFVCFPNMSDNEIKIQSAIWELVTTEVDYIHALQTVTDVSCDKYMFSSHDNALQHHFTDYIFHD